MSRDIYIRDIKLEDLHQYKILIHPDREFHKYNGPYYPKMSEIEIDQLVLDIEKRILKDEPPLSNKKMIVDKKTDELIGQVNWYWKSEETLWLEVGIVIFNERYWGKGIGNTALPIWINEVFEMFPEIVRIGLSTWSGNDRMIKLAERIGLKKEAEYIDARIINGKYYDSLSYGILKRDWVLIHNT